MKYEYVLGATVWARSEDERLGVSYWSLLRTRAKHALADPSKKTIMRNQLHLGFSNNYWPTLSRLLIMDEPELAKKIHPRTSELDSDEGRSLLIQAFKNITGHSPVISDWRLAVDR